MRQTFGKSRGLIMLAWQCQAKPFKHVQIRGRRSTNDPEFKGSNPAIHAFSTDRQKWVNAELFE